MAALLPQTRHMPGDTPCKTSVSDADGDAGVGASGDKVTYLIHVWRDDGGGDVAKRSLVVGEDAEVR